MSDTKEQEIFTRRVLLLGSMQGILFTTLIGRMYMLQVQSKRHYQQLSDKNRIQPQLLLPERGQILDRSGIVLADNKITYSASIMRIDSKTLHNTLAHLKNILNLSNEDI